MSEARSTDLHTVWLVATIGHHVDAELALGMLYSCIRFSGRHVHAFGEQLEMVDEIFHAKLHAFPGRRRHFVVVDDDGAGIVAQPLDTLTNDAIALAHFPNAAQV